MEEYLVERETLEKFVNELMKKGTLPVESADEVGALREKMIQELDDEIGKAVFDNLNEPQLAALEQLLDDPNTSEKAFRGFFERTGINVDEKIAEAIKGYSERFLGGKNE